MTVWTSDKTTSRFNNEGALGIVGVERVIARLLPEYTNLIKLDILDNSRAPITLVLAPVIVIHKVRVTGSRPPLILSATELGPYWRELVLEIDRHGIPRPNTYQVYDWTRNKPDQTQLLNNWRTFDPGATWKLHGITLSGELNFITIPPTPPTLPLPSP